MKLRKDIWILTLVGVMAGFFVIRTIETQHPELRIDNMLTVGGIERYLEEKSVRRIEQYLLEEKAEKEKKEELMKQIRALEATIDDYEKAVAEKINKGKEIQEELNKSRILAGMTDLKGPGIEIVLNDRKRESVITSDPRLLGYYIVHDSDLLDVVNELRAAGAEAIAINGVRIIGTSRISCGGPTINVGKEQRFTPPFVIHAIGDPEALAGFFKREDSVYHSLVFWGLEFSIRKKDVVEIPRYMGKIDFKYAKPIEEGE